MYLIAIVLKSYHETTLVGQLPEKRKVGGSVHP